MVRLPAQGVHVASASPERFLSIRGRRVWSSPIKGTAATPDGFLAKDRAENVMIVDLVRNDLGRVCDWGSIRVPHLVDVETHPGLVHLVSTVEGRLRPGTGWADAIAATFPPGSVTGAPKLAALDHIARLEPVDRGVYCGAVGWVDADLGHGELNVAIRTFWLDEGQIHFGTGGAVTWDSTPAGEWAETELKACRLLALASPTRAAFAGARRGKVRPWLNRAAPWWPSTASWSTRPRRPSRPSTTGSPWATASSRPSRSCGAPPSPSRRHLRRLRRSLAGLGIELAVGDDALRATMAEVVAANHLDAGRLRLTVTGGVSPLGSDRGAAGPTVVVATAALPAWEPATAVVTVEWPRNERSAVAGLKTTSYAENVVALERAHGQGASEAIFANTAGPAVRGHRQQHLRGRGRPAAHAAAGVGLPGRHHPRAGVRAGGGGRGRPGRRRPGRGRRGLPDLVDPRRAGHRTRSTAGPCPRPGPLTGRGRRRLRRPDGP